MMAGGKRVLFAAVLCAAVLSAGPGSAAEAVRQAALATASATASVSTISPPAPSPAPQSTGLPAGTPAAAAELVRYPTFSVAGVIEARNRVIPLAGVAATALDLQCGEGPGTWPCGRAARTALQGFVRGRTVACQPPQSASSASGVARCSVAGRDIGEWLVAQGWAAAEGPDYTEAEKTAKAEKRGIWNPVRPAAIQIPVTGGDASLSSDAVLRAEVALSTQSMTVTYRGAVIGEWPVSTARDGKETPTGVWTAKWLSRDHRSRLYNDAPMPYSIFFEGDYAIHGTYQTRRLGQPASHGCVRLSPKNAKLLFSLAAKEGVDNTLIVIRP